MGWQIVDTTGEDDHNWARIKFASREAAQKHANFLNAEEERKNG